LFERLLGEDNISYSIEMMKIVIYIIEKLEGFSEILRGFDCREIIIN
jgi:hypothetical protein